MDIIKDLLPKLLQQPGITIYLAALFVIGQIEYCAYKLALSGVNMTYQFVALAIVGIMATLYSLYLYKGQSGDFDD